MLDGKKVGHLLAMISGVVAKNSKEDAQFKILTK